jgi:hypothetical protein
VIRIQAENRDGQGPIIEVDGQWRLLTVLEQFIYHATGGVRQQRVLHWIAKRRRGKLRPISTR